MSRAVTELRDASAACEIERSKKHWGAQKGSTKEELSEPRMQQKHITGVLLGAEPDPGTNSALLPAAPYTPVPAVADTLLTFHISLLGRRQPKECTASTFLLHSLWCSLQAMGTQSYCNIPVLAGFRCQERRCLQACSGS